MLNLDRDGEVVLLKDLMASIFSMSFWDLSKFPNCPAGLVIHLNFGLSELQNVGSRDLGGSQRPATNIKIQGKLNTG